MTSADLVRELWQATLSGSAGILLVLAVRRPAARMLGARVRYALWLAVPAAMLATCLPAAISVGRIRLAEGPLAAVAGLPRVATAPDRLPWPADDVLLLAWLAGALLSTAAFAWQQRRYLARAMPAQWEPQPLLPTLPRWRRARSPSIPPALVGAWRPWLLLPHDFESRYSAAERELVLLHESIHLQRRDALANLAIAMLRVLFWFNPLVHLAASRVRLDQELACDAAVVSDCPGRRRPYAEAMLKTQLAAHGLPVGCHWQPTHPLEERIAMLTLTPWCPMTARRSRLLVASALALTGITAWAMQPPTPAAPGQAVIKEVAADALQPPPYPEGAIAAGEEGMVLLEVLVRADGSAGDIRAVREKSDASERLVEAAIERARSWRFSPRMENGTAMESWVQVPVTFSLADEGLAPAAYATITPLAYPSAAREAGIEGYVVLEVVVDPAGRPVRVEIADQQPPGVFAAAAHQVAQGWTFTPGTHRGEAATTVVDVPIAFVLGDQAAPAVPRRKGWTLDTLEVRP